MKDWIQATLGEVCHVYQPQTLAQKQLRPGPFPVFGANGQIGWHDEFNHEPEQLALGCRGSVGFVHTIPERSWINGNAMVVVPREGVIDRDFLAYALRGGVDISASITGAAQPQITRASLNPIPIGFPADMCEQRRIVAILDEAFEGIATAKANAEKNMQNARELFESHLDLELKRHADGYEETTLGAEVELLAGYAFSSGSYSDAEGDVRLLRGDNIMQGYLRWEGVKRWPANDCAAYARFALREGDVVLAMDRPWVKAGLKRAQITSEDLPCLQVQRTARLRCEQTLRQDFLFHLTGSQSFSRHLLEAQTGIGVPHISGKQIEGFRFMRPPLNEQAFIAARLNELYESTQQLADISQSKLAALDELKKSLLHQAFSGQL